MRLQVENITVCHNKVNIVENISFSLESGQVLGLIGPNGCGKSTLMKALIGAVSKTGETNLILFNKEIPITIDELTFGFIPEEPILYEYLSVMSNFQLTSVSKGIYDNFNEIVNLIRILKLEHLTIRKARSLSQGEKKRLAIGLALVGNPDVLILDEPHNGLDIDGMAILKSIIRVKSKDHIIILCSHYFSEIESLCSQILVLNKGKVFVNDSINSILGQHQSIEKLFNSQIYKLTDEASFTF
jgi:ABC-type multidrug transport system ATPase subunit